MRRIASEVDYLLRRLATALAVVMIGVALTFVGSAAAASGDKEVKEVKGVKIEKVEKEVKELKADSKARINRNQVFLNRNLNNRILVNRNIRNLQFIRPFGLERLLEEEID